MRPGFASHCAAIWAGAAGGAVRVILASAHDHPDEPTGLGSSRRDWYSTRDWPGMGGKVAWDALPEPVRWAFAMEGNAAIFGPDGGGKKSPEASGVDGRHVLEASWRREKRVRPLEVQRCSASVGCGAVAAHACSS